MKRRNLFLFAAAALSLSFAACTKDGDGVETGHREVITSEMATSYAKVKICESGGATGTRSDFDDPQFDSGEWNEGLIEDITLVLYDESNNVVGTGEKTTPFQNSSERQDNQNVSQSHEYVFKLTLNEGANTPKKVVAFINMVADEESNLNVEAPETLTADKLTKKKNNKTYLAMTNSGYFDATGTYVVGAEISHIYPSEEAAIAGDKAADIYVERLAAKVVAYEKEDATKVPTATIKDIDGKEVEFTFKSRNWGATATAKEMHQIKKKFDYNANTESWKNYLIGHRSFWAEGVYYGDKGYADYLPGSDGSTLLKYLSLKETDKALNSGDGAVANPSAAHNYCYVPEHTYNYDAIKDANDFTPLIPSTSVIVIGNYELEGEHADWFDDAYKDRYNTTHDFYLIKVDDNEYRIFTKSQLIAFILSAHGVTFFYQGEETFEGHLHVPDNTNKYGYKRCDQYGYQQADKPNLTWQPFDLTKIFELTKEADGKYRLSYSEEFKANQRAHSMPEYVSYGEELEDDEIEQDFTIKSYAASHYNHGFAYFYQPLKHNLELTDQTGYYGVVRNHEYVLTVNKYAGIGAPLDEDNTDDNEEEPIIPEPDKTPEHYLDANIRVLSWHRINQSVDF